MIPNTNTIFISAKHKKTLDLIFSRPTPASVKWEDAVGLLKALGAEISEREGSRVAFYLFGQISVMHRPHPTPELDKGAAAALRRWLEGQWSETMKNVMMIADQRAVISYDPDIELFRGEFIGLNGGADFYAADIAGLRCEGEVSLQAFLEECAQRGIEPRKTFSGKFMLRIKPEVHEAAALAAAAQGESLNQWVAEAIEEAALA